MKRRIITIDQEKCNGCGLCAKACHEGAIGMVDGKAKLLREDYCDGLGDCLPACPTGAISFEVREAPAYDEAAVLAARKAKEAQEEKPLPCGCPGSSCQSMKPAKSGDCADVPSQLRNFPIQLKLVPVNAPYFDGADLLIAADCTAYAYGNFHREFMNGRVTLIGCPKLDAGSYAEKLEQIFTRNNIKSVTVTRMVVPCCGGLPFAVQTALEASGKEIPYRVVTITPNGDIID
ncbi:MAG: ferredoxin [Ruminococcaceae bacterium]|nr:ferredoxin [Oscillospiraceae bacterium]